MIAVITGASSGLGEAMARLLDEQGYETVLVARGEEKLEKLKSELTHPSRVLAADLSKAGEAERVFAFCPEADVLINNAGFGTFGAMTDSDIQSDERMIAVNVTSAYVLLKLYLEKMKERGHGYILNTASSAAFMAGPYFGLYYATKAFVMRASQAAAREAKEYGVFVSAFCPGSVATDFNRVAGTTSSTRPIDARTAAERALKGLFKGRALVIPTAKMRAAFVMSKLMPEPWLTEFSAHVQKKRMK